MYLFILIIDFVALIVICIVINLFLSLLILGFYDLTLEKPTIAIDESMVLLDDV